MDETDDRGLDGIGGVSEVFNGVHNRNDQAETCSTEDSDELNGSGGEDGRTGSLTDSIVVLETEGEDGNLILRMLENVEEGGDVGSDQSPLEVKAPFVGMKFSSGVEFVAYMHIYGHAKGFGVRIRDPVKDQMSKAAAATTKLGKLEKWFNLENKYKYYMKIRMVCRKAGVHKSKSCDPNRSTTTCRTNCPYAVNACRGSVIGSSWKITMVSEPIPEGEFGCHNHALSPDLCRHLPRYRRISVQDQIIAMELHRGGVGVANMYDIFVNRYKFYELVPFTETDLRNYIYFVDRKPLKDTYFGKMEVHFRKMREHSPHFFYEFDVDQETNVPRNVLWVDSRCIETFKEFGDVVSVDTTFVTNRYKMPFAPFVGVNHHGKTILLGCALIGKEDAASFSWVFRIWKKCMGKQPDCILTDQDKAIGLAIPNEFPGISHRWCIWHVMQNARKHLGMRTDWWDIEKKLYDILYDSYSVDEFEAEWHNWVQVYGVDGINWVTDMYKDMAKWAPVYFKSKFWAGMSSTQRSEGMNHYLKGFVDINTCLAKFVEEYGKAVCKRAEKEEKDTVLGDDRHSQTTSDHPFEKCFEQIYTRDKFIKIHD